jgi:hypothetical protein
MLALRLAFLCLSVTASMASTPPGLHALIALLPKGQINRPYPPVSLITGGTPPFTTQIDGALPRGMAISRAGALYGTPRDPGIFRFKLDITDSAGTPLELSYTLQIFR